MNETVDTVKESTHEDLEKDKYELIDILKFIFEIFVVGIHTGIMTDSNDTFEWYILHIFFRMAVPFFFIASGFLYGKSFIKNKQNLRKITKNQIKRLLIPFIFWMLVSLPYIIMTTKGDSTLDATIEIVKKFIFYPWGALWFILALIVAILIEYWVLKKGKIKIAICIGVILYIICLLGNSYYFLLEGTPFQRIMDLYRTFCITTRNGIFEAFPIFSLGVYIATKEKSIEKISKNKIILCFIIALLIEIFEITFIRTKEYRDDHSLFFTTIVIASLLLMFCIKFKKIRIKKIDTKILRNLSTSLYFMHSPIINYLSLLHIYIWGNYKMTIMLVSAIIIINLVLYKIDNKYINYIIK